MEELWWPIRQRRSVRSFRPEEVPVELLTSLLQAACLAPSAGNLQPWRFYVVRAPNVKRALARAARQAFVAQAPVVIVVCAMLEQSASVYGDRGRYLYCLQDTAAALENLLLAAAATGLGACWVGAFVEEEASRALGLSGGIRPVALVPLGYAAENPPPVPRRALDEVVRWVD